MFKINKQTMKIVNDNLNKINFDFCKKLYGNICKVVEDEDLGVYMYNKLNSYAVTNDFLTSILNNKETFCIDLDLIDFDVGDDIDYCTLRVNVQTSYLFHKNLNWDNYSLRFEHLSEAVYCGDLNVYLEFSEADVYFEEC